MDITISDEATVHIIGLAGRFDAHEVDGFAAAVDRLIESGSTDLGVDLSGVDFIDSSALAELVRVSKATKAEGGSLELHNPSDPVRVILELTGLDKAFVVHQNQPAENLSAG